jgi:thiol-disulfide isomerase/thioredoxin
VVKKSLENQIFLDYVRFLGEKKKEGEAIKQRMDATQDPIAKARDKEQLVQLDKAIKDYMKTASGKNPTTYAASLIRMSMDPDHVEIKRADGTVDSSATYYHYRQHYWDNTDLTDERILRAPVFQNKFDEYIGTVVPQIPDTINKMADDLIGRMSATPELWKFAVHNITYKYETSEIMGMDAVFVHMAQTYYCPKPGEASKATWMSKEKLDKLCERARKQAPLIIGAKSRDIILTDTTEQKWISMHRMPSEFVLIVFWDPHCGHCKKTLPDLYQQYKEKLKPIGVEVYSVAKATDSTLFADWKAFIREHDMQWTNVGLTWHVFAEARKNSSKFIPGLTTIESLNYSETWDVYTTPRFFLVDADRKIVGKQIEPDKVVKLVEQLRKNKAKQQGGK